MQDGQEAGSGSSGMDVVVKRNLIADQYLGKCT